MIVEIVYGLVIITVTVIAILITVYVQEHSPVQRLSDYLDIQDRDPYLMLVLVVALLFFALVFSLLTFLEWVL